MIIFKVILFLTKVIFFKESRERCREPIAIGGEVLIKINGLYKSYNNINVLSDINLHIKPKEIYGLVGKSGVGKSTLLRCINGLESIDKGSIIVDGVDLNKLGKKELCQFRSNIGMIFQQFMLMERMTVSQNIAFPMKCRNKPKDVIHKRINELLELVELQDKRNSKPRELSGGQKQRVAIARALAMNPKIILCDEATSALDSNITKSILALLRKINKELGLTIIVVTHQMSVVKQTCNRMSILSEGNLVCTGNVEDVFIENPKNLIELLSEDSLPVIPQDGLCIEIIQRKHDSSSLLSRLAIETGVPFELLWSKMDKYFDEVSGSYIIHIHVDDYSVVEGFLNLSNVTWRIWNGL